MLEGEGSIQFSSLGEAMG